MADLPKFMLMPERGGYGATLADTVITTDTQYGLPRQRLGGVGLVHSTSPTYRCTKPQYQYAMAFYRAYQGLSFLSTQLIDDSEPTWYETRIIGAIKHQVVGYGVFDVSFNVVCEPIAYDVQTDLAITAIYEMTSGESDKYFNMLEKLVNQDLPQAMRGLK